MDDAKRARDAAVRKALGGMHSAGDFGKTTPVVGKSAYPVSKDNLREGLLRGTVDLSRAGIEDSESQKRRAYGGVGDLSKTYLADRKYAGLSDPPTYVDPAKQVDIAELIDRGSHGDDRPEIAMRQAEAARFDRAAQGHTDALDELTHDPTWLDSYKYRHEDGDEQYLRQLVKPRIEEELEKEIENQTPVVSRKFYRKQRAE